MHTDPNPPQLESGDHRGAVVAADTSGHTPADAAALGSVRMAAFDAALADLDDPKGLRALLRILWRQRWVIAATVVGLTLLTSFIVHQIEPRYTAAAQVMIDVPQTQVVKIEAIQERRPTNLDVVESQMAVIRSRDLARGVIEQARLREDPEMNPAIAADPTPPLMERVSDLMANAFAAVSPAHEPDARTLPAEDRAEAQQVRVVERFLDRLSVTQQGQSQVIEISFTSVDPAKARRVANAVAEAYVDRFVAAKIKATDQANAWLRERLPELRQRAQEAQSRVEALQVDLGVDDGSDTSLIARQISELSGQLQMLRAERQAAEARLEQTELLIATRGGAETASDVLNSPLIQRLREQEAAVARTVQEMAAEFGPSHPRMEAVNRQHADIRERIRQEAQRVVDSLRNEVGVIAAREASLETSIETLRASARELSGKEVELTLATQEAAATRGLYDSLLARARELNDQAELQQSDAAIVSRADTPITPSFPRVQLVILVGFLGSAFTGVFLAIARDHLTHVGFRTSAQARRDLDLPVLGLVPALGRFGRLGRTPFEFMGAKPRSSYAAAFRQLGVRLGLETRPDDRVILVTSAQAGEGKTSFATCLARERIAAGKKVVVVDADLWRPRVHETFGVRRRPGLTDHLIANDDLEDSLVPERSSGCRVVTAGTPALNGGRLLSSARMEHLIDALKAEFDMIIIDSPPVMSVAATLTLGRLADRTIVVIRWEKTRREIVLTAVQELTKARARIAGVVLTWVNPGRLAGYSYSDRAYSDYALAYRKV